MLDFATLELSATIFQHMAQVLLMLVNPIVQNHHRSALFDLLFYFSFSQAYLTIFVFDRYGILHLVLYTLKNSMIFKTINLRIEIL